MACAKYFPSTNEFDRHRVGLPHIHEGPDRRRCLATEEMIEAGWCQANGLWRSRQNQQRIEATRSYFSTKPEGEFSSKRTLIDAWGARTSLVSKKTDSGAGFDSLGGGSWTTE